MKITKAILVCSLGLTSILFSCKEKKQATLSEKLKTEKQTVPSSISAIEKAHLKDEFLKKEAIQFDIAISFGGNKILDGKITLLTNSTKAIIELKDGSKIVVDQNKVFHTPTIKNEPMVRFHAYTWSYFFLFPYKLSDKGTKWSEFSNTNMRGNTFNTQKLTFENSIGDTPDDWYYVYSNSKTNLLTVAAYIVTYGKETETAEKDPHAIEYTNFTTIEGIPFATDWKFWGWNKEEGLTQQIGKASLKNIQFVKNVDFSYPKDFTEK